MSLSNLFRSIPLLHSAPVSTRVHVDAAAAQSIPVAGAVLAVDPAVIDLRPVKAEPGSVLAKAWASVQRLRAASPPAAVVAAPVPAPSAAVPSPAVAPRAVGSAGLPSEPSPLVRDFTVALSRKELSGKPALLEMMAKSDDPAEKRKLKEMIQAMDSGMDAEEFVARAKVRAELEAVVATSKDNAERWRAAEAMGAVMDRSIPLASIQLPTDTARRRGELEALLASPDNQVRWDACLALDALDRGEAAKPFTLHSLPREKAGACPSCSAELGDNETQECSVCGEICCPECSSESEDGSITCSACNDHLGVHEDDDDESARVEAHLSALVYQAKGRQLRWDIAEAITRAGNGENVQSLAYNLTVATLEERAAATTDAAEKSKLAVELAALISAGKLPRATAAEIASAQAAFDRESSAHPKTILGLRLRALKLSAA